MENKCSIYIGILLVFLFLIPAQAQKHSLNVHVGAGYGRFLTDMDQTGLNQNGFLGTFRIMWQPEHLLRIGLESGYHSLYNYKQTGIGTDFGVTDAQSSLTAIPVFFIAAMEIIPSFEIIAGLGATFLNSSFESFGLKTESTQLSTSQFVSAQYSYALNKKFSLGSELRFYRINKIEDSTLSLQIILGYKLLEW